GVHALYMLEALLGEIEDVTAQFSSRAGDPNLLFNEWRAQVRCRNGPGHVHLSWNVKPYQNMIWIQGTHGVIRSDGYGLSRTTRKAGRRPEVLQRAVNAWGEACHTLLQVPAALVKMACTRVLRFHGVQLAIAAFYRNLEAGKPAPFPPEKTRPIVDWT